MVSPPLERTSPKRRGGEHEGRRSVPAVRRGQEVSMSDTVLIFGKDA